jgi:hypothetical protein
VRKALLSLVMGLVMTGCAMTPKTDVDPFVQQAAMAAQTLKAAKAAVIASAEAVDGMCSQALISQKDCDRAADIYFKAESAYYTARAALVVGIDTKDMTDFNTKVADTNELLIRLTDTIARIKGGRP